MDGTENQKDRSDRRGMEWPKFFAADDSLESSSSIGAPNDSGEDEQEGEEEVQSDSNRRIGLNSLNSLEDFLPVKKGLSSHFDGQSKSFTDLSQVSSLKEFQKKENPINKRRRVLVQAKRSRRSSPYNCSNPESMPPLPLHEEEKCRKQLASPSSSLPSSSDSLNEEKKQENQMLPLQLQNKSRLEYGSFKLRSFSAADLKERDGEEEE